MIGKTWEEGGKGALLGAGLGAAVPGAPCGGMGRGEGGSALQWPLPHSQGALLQRQRSLTQTSGASAPLWETLTTSTATLPTVINQATTPSLWDSSKKITTGSCSTLRHHTHPTHPAWGAALWTDARRSGGNGALHWLALCCKHMGVLLQNKHLVLPFPLPASKGVRSLSRLHLPCACGWLPAAGSGAAAVFPGGWVMYGAAGHPHRALPHSSSAQPVPVLSHP